MIGGVTRYMLPRLPGFPSLHVNRPIVLNFSYNCYAYHLLLPLFFPHSAQILLENALLLVFSVTPFKIDQPKYQNHSVDKVKNLGNERR